MTIGGAISTAQRVVRETFAENPIAWVLIALLVLAECGQQEIARDLHRLCDLTGEHYATWPRPVAERQQIDNICAAHEPAEDE